MVYRANPKPLKELPKDLLPREKMLKLGSNNLSEEELWAIILGSGTKGFSVLDIANKLTEIGFEKLASLSVEELSKIPGVGRVKALTIKAVLELCSRNKNGEKPKITSPKQVEELIRPLIKTNKEHLFVLTLSLAQKLLGIDLIAVGSLNIVYAPLREIFQPVISKNGYFFILVHNHPQGDCSPSPEDKSFTERVIEGAKLLDLELLDHVIIDERGYFSFRENGLL
jgi:DNA repair protein RadC